MSLAIEDLDGEEEHEMVIGYECLSCGHQQESKGFHQCEVCCGPLTEIYE
jgi:hypothetical protein